MALANRFANAMLMVYDAVVFTDVDEFLVPDPAKYDGLHDYVGRNSHRDIVAPLAVNVLHAPQTESPIVADRPVLEQRRFVKVAPNMCKPLVKRVASPWMEGFHGTKDRFEIDHELLMVHLKYYDAATLREVADRRQKAHEVEGRGAASSAWSIDGDELVSRLESWVSTAGEDVQLLEPDQVKVENFVGKVPNGYRARGQQLVAMEKRPLLRLPERFSATV
jgi:hypothetical protein